MGSNAGGYGRRAMDLEIRPYETGDYDACRALWVELTERHRTIYNAPSIGGDDPGAGWDELLANPAFHGAWVGVVDDAPAALMGLLLDGREGELEPLIVTERLRGRGIGRQMVEHLAEEAKRRGLTYLNVKAVARNAAAMQAYHRYGFQTLGMIEMFIDLQDEPGEWVDGIEIHGLRFTY